MQIFIVLSGMGLFLLGYILMDQLDRTIENKVISSDYYENRIINVLIFGLPEKTEIRRGLQEYLNHERISCLFVNDVHIPKNISFQFGVALSDSDLENLLFCETVKHSHSKVRLVARCNDLLYKRLFKDAGIQRILTGDVSPFSLVLSLKGEEWKFSEGI